MRENLDVIKRLLAIGLTVFLVGSTLFGDFIVIADQENHCEEFSDDYSYTEDGTLVPGEYSDGYCDDCGRGEEYHEHIEVPQEEKGEVAAESTPEQIAGETPETGAGEDQVPATDEQIQQNPEQPDVTNENADNTNGNTTDVVENQQEGQNPAEPNPQETADGTQESTEATDVITDKAETETPDKDKSIEETTPEEKTQEELDKEAEEKRLAEEKEKEEKEKAEKEKQENCDHQWGYASNGDGTHTMKCTECGKEATEECTYDETGKCIHCGFENPEEKECEHEWAYTSNNDGTHTKKCTKCDIEEVEECQLNADGVCELCGYEDERLIHQTFTRTIHGVTVTVDGMMPRGSKVTIFTKPLEQAATIVNESIEQGSFTAFEVFDIDIYTRGGDKYQPVDNGDAVSVTFAGISELSEVGENEEIAVFRIEDDKTVTEVENEVAGEDVSFEAEHFSQYVAGTISSENLRDFKKYEKIGYVGRGTANYTKVTQVDFAINLESTEKETTNFTAYLYKNVDPNGDLKESGTLIDTQVIQAKKSNGNKGVIQAIFNVPEDNYILKGQYYAVVVETDNSCKIYFSYDTANTSTYIYSDTQVWGTAPSFQNIFKETVKTEAATISDSHYISGIKATKGDASGTTYAETYIYGKQKAGSTTAIDTLEAVFDDSNIDRIVTWKSENPEIVTINETTGEIIAKNTGETTISAKYNDASQAKTITIQVMGFTMDGWDPDGTSTQPVYNYTGSKRIPATIAYIGNVERPVTRVFSNNENVGTASVEITYTPDNGKTYVFTRSFTISALTLTDSVFTDANIIRDANGNIVEINGLNPVAGVTPKYNSSTKDFTFTTNSIVPVTNGVEYNLNITGKGNFTGILVNQIIVQKNVLISDVIGVRLSSQSRLANLTYTGKPVVLTETSTGSDNTGWAEVEFYNRDTDETLENVITKANCTYTILNSAGEADSTSAGTHRIDFTMTNGYSGSLSLTFEIQRPSLRNTTIQWKNPTKKFYHKGQPIEPVKGNSLAEEGVDFIVVAADGTPVDKSNYEAFYSGLHTDIGSYTLTIWGRNNYDSETNQQDTYEIVADFALDMRVRLYVDGNMVKDVAKNGDYYETGYSRVYDGTDTRPELRIFVPGEGELSGDKYFTVIESDSPESNTFTKNVGTKYLKIIPQPDLKTKYPTAKEQTATYKVTQCPINSSKVKVTRKSNIEKTYTTKPITLIAANDEGVMEANGDIMLRYGTAGEVLQYKGAGDDYDYDITYNNNTDVGTASYVIEAKKDASGQYTGNYSGKISVSQNTFTIKKAKIKTEAEPLGTVEVEGPNPPSFIYNGKDHRGEVTFTVKINGNTVDPSNYDVSYSDNCISPTNNAYVQITGKNNIEGTTRLKFTISASNEPYKGITIDGKNVDLSNPTIVNGTRVYVSNITVPYTGQPYDKPVVVYGIDAQPLNQPGERLSYDAEFKNTVEAKEYDEDDPDHSPRLEIKGLNNYAGNNAIVYFNVAPIDISSEDINFSATEYDKFVKVWTKETPVSLRDLVITVNGRTLVEGTSSENDGKDYWVEYESEPKPSTAGSHKVIIHGYGNYKGTRELPYKIGMDIKDAYVAIYGPYLPADPINPNTSDTSINVDKFMSLTKIASMVSNYGTKATALKNAVKWRGNDKAPRIRIYKEESDTEPLTEYASLGDTYYDYDLTMETEFGDYCSRQPGQETTTNYNIVKVKIDADEGTSGYYGTATFYFAIYPQEISKGGGYPDVAVGIASTDAASKPYTGKKQSIVPSIQFYNGGPTAIDLNRTESGVLIKDFTPASYEIGPNLSTKDETTTLKGIGNFTGEIIYKSRITKGNVNIFGSKNGATAQKFIRETQGEDPVNNNPYQPYVITLDMHSAEAVSKGWGIDTFKYNGKSQKPVITLTSIDQNHKGEATSETITLTPGTDYTENIIDIETNTNDTTSVGKKRMTLTLTNSNFYKGTINIDYEIVTNTIEGFNATLSSTKYKGEKYTADEIKALILDGKMKLSIIDKIDKATGVELIREKDYVIVTDKTELTAINTQFGTNYSDVIVPAKGNFEPSYNNYIFVRGKGTYSEYCRVPFTIYLDITSTNGENGLAKVYFDGLASEAPRWPLADENNIGSKLKIKYKTSASASTYEGILPLTSTIAGQVENNYSITRGNPGKPGPDEHITVTGANLAMGEASGIKHGASDPLLQKTVCFQADLSTYGGLAFTNDIVLDCTGEAYKPEPSGLQGTAGTTTSTTDAYGDYVITYKHRLHKADTSSTNLTEAKAAGYYELYVAATGNSEYYLSNTGTRFHFYVKYNLSKATMKFYNDSSQAIVEMSYTGEPFKIVERTVITSEGWKAGDPVDLYNYGSPQMLSLVELSPTSVTQVKYNPGYTITATAKDEELVYGSKTATFSIKVVSLTNATFEAYDPWGLNTTTEKRDYEYTGSNIEPTIKGYITVGGVKKTLTEGVDFAVVYHNQKEVSTDTQKASYTIIGLGAYECPEFTPANNTYTINPLDLNLAAAANKLRIDVAEATYGGYYNDYTNHNLGTVKQEPEIEVYYVDDSKGIENKLQMETAKVAGDYKIKYYTNNTKAEVATAEAAPTVGIEAGRSGNTVGSTYGYDKKFTINKLNLANRGVEITQNSAQFTGGPINVFDVVKITSGATYKIGDTVYPVYLVQKGADADLDSQHLYDYDITVTKDGVTYRDGQITDIGTYNITIEGKNNCIGQITSETFTITERSLPDNFHYYYSTVDNKFHGKRKELKNPSDNKLIGYEYEGGFEDATGNITDTLIIRVYDVETLGAEDNPDNKPRVEIIDQNRLVAKNSGSDEVTYVYEDYPLTKDEYTLSVENNTTAGTGDWARTVTADKHAPVAAGSPTVTITGAGSYSGTLTLPYSIGKNIVNIAGDLKIIFTLKDAFGGIPSVEYDGSDDVRWRYTYNGAEQVPKVNTIKYGNVNLVNGTDFTLTFTDGVGNTDTSINAGYKYAVITGKGTYCGTLKTKYAINKKLVEGSALTFTNEKPMTTDHGEYVFAITGGAVKRLTTEKAQELLTDIPTDKRAQYKDYYYAIYDGAEIKPDVIVNDNTLSKYAKTTVIDAERDLDIIPESANAVSTFDPATGALGNCSYLAVSFKDNTGDAENFASGSNYYVPSNSSIIYRISYLILRHNLADDFYIKFKEEGLSNTGKDWTGNYIEPEIDVYNGKRDPLIRSIDDGATGDYVVEYSNNILPGVATVKVTGIKNYKGTKTANFTIWGHLEDTTIYFKDSDGQLVSTEYDPLPVQAYTGGPIVPDVVLKLDRKPGSDQQADLPLTLGSNSSDDYQYYVSKNESPDGTFFSKGIVTFTGNSNQYWSGDKSLEYNIEYDEDKVSLSIDKKQFRYTGFAIKPTKDEIDVSITTAIKVNVRYFRDLDNDGEITYSEEITNDKDFIDLGDIKVMMTYKVGSSDEKTAEGTYTIVPRPLDDVAGDDCTVVMATNQRYTGYAVQPAVSVSIISYDSNGNKQVKELEAYDEITGEGDYIIDYGDYVYSKTENDAKVVLTAKAPYITGNMTLPYTIKLQNIVNLRVTEKTGESLTVAWVKDLYSTGTELELQTGGKTVAIVKAVGKKNTQVFKNLKGSTEYTVLARAYAVVSDDEVIFSHKDSSVTDTTDMATADMDVVSTSKGKATVTWGTEGTVKVYYIYRASNATDEGTLVAIIPATTGSFTNSKLTSGVTYYFHTVGYGLVDGELAPVNKSEPKKVTVL